MHQKDPLLSDVLREVSRSFYLTIRALPPALRRPMGIAYLLARSSDTIADTSLLPAEVRLQSLQSLLTNITGNCTRVFDFETFLINHNNVKEKVLLERMGESLALFQNLDSEDRTLISRVLKIIISGQMLDVKRFHNASANSILCLSKSRDLEDYIYRVAGCVGEFWTRLCFRHLSPHAKPSAQLIERSIRFGKGLQLINILRDLAEDLSQGRCYFPKEDLLKKNLTPKNMTLPESQSHLSALVRDYARLAIEHLEEGWEYTCALPRAWFRVRLACALPILLGFETMARLPLDRPLCEKSRAKVSRSKVKCIVLQTALLYPLPRAWARMGRRRAKRISRIVRR